MTHRQIALLCFSLFLATCFCAKLHAQIIIQPPILGNDVGQYQVLEINLINTSGQEKRTYISYEIQYGEKSPDRLTASGTSKVFTIPVTGLLVHSGNIQSLFFPLNTDINPPTAFSEYLIRNSKFPDGSYRICIRVFDEVSKVEMGFVCYTFKIENLNSIFLLSPFNNETINNEYQWFNWTAITQLSNPLYELVLIEVLKGQSLIQAAKTNPAFFTQQVSGNMTQLSFGARNMNNKSTYLWYVRLVKDNKELARSELWNFRFEAATSNTQTPELSRSGNGNASPLTEKEEKEMEVKAPELVFPKHNVSIRFKDLDTVEFQWKHERSQIKGAIIYEYRLLEVNESGTKEDSLVFTSKKKDELKLILPKSLKLREGKRYHWEVLATGNKKLKPCKKGCSSASYVFELGHNPTTLQFVKMSAVNKSYSVEVKDQLNFTCCDEIIHHDGISLELLNENKERVLIIDSICVKDSNEKLIQQSPNKFSLLISDLKAGETYEIKVGNKSNFEYLKFIIPRK